MPWISPLLDVDQGDFQGEIRMGKDTREVDQFVKNVQPTASLGAESAAQDLTALRVLANKLFANHNRLDH